MAVIHLSATAGADGILHLEVPVGLSGPYEVQIVASPKADDEILATAEQRGWPPGYFESTYGSIDDETFVAPERRRSEPTEELFE
jgi:hypothetical protein